MVKRALVAVVVLLLGFVGLMWWALESSGVAVVETERADGSRRSTHVWYVVRDGELWLEAGTPENGWFRDVGTTPRLTLRSDGRVAEYVPEPMRDPSAHGRIRLWLRDKYGFRDRWVALIFDTSRSVAVRLLPPAPTGSG